jgi:hypothetical protein
VKKRELSGAEQNLKALRTPVFPDRNGQCADAAIFAWLALMNMSGFRSKTTITRRATASEGPSRYRQVSSEHNLPTYLQML